MFHVWLKAGNDVYAVSDHDPLSVWQVVEFLAAISYDGERPLDPAVVLPHLDAEPGWLSQQELEALFTAEILISEASGEPLSVEVRPSATYEMELLLRDGSSEFAVGPVEKLTELWARLEITAAFEGRCIPPRLRPSSSPTRQGVGSSSLLAGSGASALSVQLAHLFPDEPSVPWSVTRMPLRPSTATATGCPGSRRRGR